MQRFANRYEAMKVYNGVGPDDPFIYYRPGGLHPIHLHDYFKDNQYEVLNLIGQGQFATVWVAQDHHKQRKVTLKVLHAKDSENNIELTILQHAKINNVPQHPGQLYLPQLLDYFFIDGPNGRHLCFVLELLGPSLDDVRECMKDLRFDVPFARRISLQLLLAVDYLHSLGFGHGDIHANNILFRVPTTVENPLKINEYRKFKNSRWDGKPLEEGIPRYSVDPIEYNRDINKYLVDIQLIDFSGSFYNSNPPIWIPIPNLLRAPELVFRRPFSNAVDIWCVAGIMTELVTGRRLFEPFFEPRTVIAHMHVLIGESSAHWLLTSLTEAIESRVWKDFPCERFWQGEGSTLEDEIPRLFYERYTGTTPRPMIEKDLEIFVRCLRKILQVDPTKRATTKELLDEEWFKVPHHYESVEKVTQSTPPTTDPSPNR